MSRLSSFQIRLLFAGIVVLAIVLGGNAPSHGATGEWESGLRPVDARIFEKWAKVSEVYAKETEWLVENAVARRNPAARSFEALIAVASSKSPMAQLTTVNAFFNRLSYRSDAATYGTDTWLTPYRLVLTGGGDCEDFALAKLFTLLRLGVMPDRLHLIVVRDLVKDRPHAVLAVEHAGMTWILDNQSKTVRPWDRSMQDYRPLYTVGPAVAGIYRTAG
ncbi:MAG: hypothetical protein HOH66_16295 [Rhodospirillaceae bacterium]|nr:hypothetical protein [Rhodospirillaceae bacterium]MBT6119426.1 hypothetical protein [Rhodospirillaceae bacterium]